MRCHPQSQNCPNTSCRRIAIIDRGVSTFYRHLCSEDDPPRSIAQDPQHKCVAFGCSASIELHWKDALSGQSLSRWFPLTAPSDYLSFLPPRPRLESNKRLRLISSTAHPGDRPTIRRKFFPSQPTSGFYCGDYDSGSTARHACDHYHAMPLSDGLHVLFVDSREDMLVFGCDAPVGGPTKLLRKVFLIPPKQDSVPLLFTAAVDLEHGARIVAVYGETIMLYSIASDIIVDSQKEQENISAAQTAVFAHNRTRDHWSNWWSDSVTCETTDNNTIEPSASVWPISLRGTEIGKLKGICELAVQTEPDLTIWAFTHFSQCRIWCLRNYADPFARTKHFICREGEVHDLPLFNGPEDTVMYRHAHMCPRSPRDRQDHNHNAEDSMTEFDGHASGYVKRIPKALSIQNDDWVDLVDVRGCSDAWYNDDGDVIMFYGAPGM